MSELPLLGQYLCFPWVPLLFLQLSQRHSQKNKHLPHHSLCIHLWFGWQHRSVFKAEIAVILATFSPLACHSSLKCGRVVSCLQLDPEMCKSSNPSCSKVWETAHSRPVCVLQCWSFLLLWKCSIELKFVLTSYFLLCLIYGLEEKKFTDMFWQIPLLTDFIIQSAIMQSMGFLEEDFMMKYGDHSVRNEGCISALVTGIPIRTVHLLWSW